MIIKNILFIGLALERTANHHRKYFQGSLKMKKLITSIIVLLLCINLIPIFTTVVGAFSSTWYVAKTGSDTTGDGTINHPFASLRKAINRSSNGDTIYMRGGNYNNVISSTGICINRSGTRILPFTIMAYNHEKVIINGNRITIATGYALLSLFRGSTYYCNITLRDLYIENSSFDGIKGGGEFSSIGKDIQIINCTINNISHHAIYFYTANGATNGYIENITVRDCRFWKMQTSLSTGECISFSGVHNYAFYNNTILWGSKILVDSGDGCKNGLIYNNTFHLNSSLSGEAIYCDSGSANDRTIKNVSIYNNLIWGYQTTNNGINCIGLCGEHSGGLLENINIYNNIINVSCNDVVDPNSCIHGINLKDNPMHDSDMVNITIKYNTIVIGLGIGKPFRCGLHRKNVKNIIVANNIFITNESRVTTYQVMVPYFNIDDGNITMCNNLYNCTYKITHKGIWNNVPDIAEISAVIMSPLFVNRKAGDFHLNATSPAIDAASSLYIVFADFDGVPRPQGTGYDIGSYEHYTITHPVIRNIRVIPNIQQIGAYINISCNVTDIGASIDEVRVNIHYPDNTAHNFSMNPYYYLNQTYPSIGIYRFYIWAIDTKKNSTISASYTFQIIPELYRALLIGLITNVDGLNGSIVSFKAKILLFIRFKPFSFNLLSSNEQIFTSRGLIGYIGKKFIIGVFNATVLLEKNDVDLKDR
jgi:hypothetical protein